MLQKKNQKNYLTSIITKAPFVRQLMNKVMSAAQKKGEVKTLLDRRCRFPKYEPVLRGKEWGTFIPAEDHERMLELQKMGPTY